MNGKLVSQLAKIVKDYCVCEKEKSTTDEITINRTKEPLFKTLVAKIISEETQHEERDLILSLACLLEVSPMTVERYMGKVCSSVGIYQKVNTPLGTIVCYKNDLP